MLAFAILVIALLVAMTPARALVGGHTPNGFPTEAWQASTNWRMAGVGWPLVLLALAWNGALGVALRRREASAELRRRTARAVTPPSGRAPVRPRDGS